MRASTLITLTLAIIIGLGVAVVAKVTGVFGTSEPEAQQPKEKQMQVLVAAKNLFAGTALDPTSVRLRPIRPDEIEHYKNNKGQYLPPVANAAFLRITKTDILADQPILENNLENLKKPEPLHSRIMPSMRAISISLNRDRCEGGVVQIGDWVDILFTSTISDSHGKQTTKTATIAPRVRIIAKRNTLWPVYAPLPKGKPIQFTVEMNPYRAALIAFAKTKGTLEMTLLPALDQKKLEGQRTALLKNREQVMPVHFINAGPEARAEENRVDAYSRGELVVDEGDLVRLFGLKTLPPPIPTQSIEQLAGLAHYSPAQFTSQGKRIYPTRGRKTSNQNTQPQLDTETISSPGFRFDVPVNGDCPACEANHMARRREAGITSSPGTRGR